MTDRLTALRELERRVEAGEEPHHHRTHLSDLSLADVFAAHAVSLDAVARLEAPLRERGWESGSFSPRPDAPHWCAALIPPAESAVINGYAATESRARLLAVIRAEIYDEEHRHADV